MKSKQVNGIEALQYDGTRACAADIIIESLRLLNIEMGDDHSGTPFEFDHHGNLVFRRYEPNEIGIFHTSIEKIPAGMWVLMAPGWGSRPRLLTNLQVIEAGL